MAEYHSEIEKEHYLNCLFQLLEAAYKERTITKNSSDNSITFSFTINGKLVSKKQAELYAMAESCQA